MIETNTARFGFDITTGCFLFNPERAFKVTNGLNKNLDEKDWVGIEIYPVQKSPSFFQFLPDVSYEKVRSWQALYPLTKISRVHIEFAYDEEERKNHIKPGDFHKSALSPFWHKLLYEQIRDAKSGYGLSLAEKLNVPINIHTNDILGFINDGLLETIKRKASGIIVENSINYHRAKVDGPILYNPNVILTEIVEKYGFNKFLLGVDHLLDYYDRQNIDPLDILENVLVKKYTVATHVAGLGHRPLKTGDLFYQKFFEKLAQTNFDNHLRIIFDYSPIGLLPLPRLSHQVQLFQDTMDWIKAILNPSCPTFSYKQLSD